MFGNLMNNNQIIEAQKIGDIKISPWDVAKIRNVHVPLTPKLLLNKGNVLHDFSQDEGEFLIEPNGYVVVELEQKVQVKEGISGLFVPSSNLIEQGFGLTAGKIESNYGANDEPIIFGLKNLLNEANPIRGDVRIAYVQFFDLRGLDNIPTEYTQHEKDQWIRRLRYAKDNGVSYGDGS